LEVLVIFEKSTSPIISYIFSKTLASMKVPISIESNFVLENSNELKTRKTQTTDKKFILHCLIQKYDLASTPSQNYPTTLESTSYRIHVTYSCLVSTSLKILNRVETTKYDFFSVYINQTILLHTLLLMKPL